MSLLDISDSHDERVPTEFRAAAADERRRTVQLDLDGRYMRSSKLEYPAKLKAVSVAHLVFDTTEALEVGERIIAHFDHLGGLDGNVSGKSDCGVEVRLNITTRKREKLSAQLTWLLNRQEFTGLEGRRHERIAVGNKSVPLRFDEGQFVECTLLDISSSGASLGTLIRPEVGTEVVVGKQNAIVRRHHNHGIGVQFLQDYEGKHLQGYLGL